MSGAQSYDLFFDRLVTIKPTSFQPGPSWQGEFFYDNLSTHVAMLPYTCKQTCHSNHCKWPLPMQLKTPCVEDVHKSGGRREKSTPPHAPLQLSPV